MIAWFWIVFVVIAAAGQTGRNMVQRELTTPLGAWGATNVRFLWGAPFAILFLIGVHLVQHQAPPHPENAFWFWIVAGSLGQIFGTALMLMTMELRSFVVATAYIKTEPVFVALFGALFLADAFTLPMLAEPQMEPVLLLLMVTPPLLRVSLPPWRFPSTSTKVVGPKASTAPELNASEPSGEAPEKPEKKAPTKPAEPKVGETVTGTIIVNGVPVAVTGTKTK